MWTPTPHEDLLVVQRLSNGEWRQCRMEDLVRGDVFRLFHPQAGDQLHPVTHDKCGDDCVGVCILDAERNYRTNQGYGVECTVEIYRGVN